MRDLSLLLGCFVKFCRFVVPQAARENLQDFRPRFTGGTDDEGAVKPLFVSPIAFRNGNLDLLARRVNLPLFLCRQGRRPRWTGGRRVRFANPRMTAKRLHPIGFRQALPNLVAGSQQSCFI